MTYPAPDQDRNDPGRPNESDSDVSHLTPQSRGSASLRPRIAARIGEAEEHGARLAAFKASLRQALQHLDELPHRAGRCDPQSGFLGARQAPARPADAHVARAGAGAELAAAEEECCPFFGFRPLFDSRMAAMCARPALLSPQRGRNVPLTNRRPDVVVYQADTIDIAPTRPEHVLLVVEIVSPGSETTDRIVKSERYARSGISFYWRVEMTATGIPVVYSLPAGHRKQAVPGQ